MAIDSLQNKLTSVYNRQIVSLQNELIIHIAPVHPLLIFFCVYLLLRFTNSLSYIGGSADWKNNSVEYERYGIICLNGNMVGKTKVVITTLRLNNEWCKLSWRSPMIITIQILLLLASRSLNCWSMATPMLNKLAWFRLMDPLPAYSQTTPP